MRKFHQNHLGRLNEAEKKERKIKKHHSEEICKCFAPLVKLHWHDCPLINKPCPIHGNRYNYAKKEENTKPVQNVTVSFYPSLKTERIFQPIKSLLTHCDPETKINFQYYSQGSLTNNQSQQITKDQFIQTNSEEFKRVLSKAFVERTKSFITGKTNKMKKLKQCFYSPCNSITRRSLSHTSVRKLANDIPFEGDQHRNIFLKKTVEEPVEDVTCESSFEWFSPRKLEFENLVKISEEKKDSDFITFTKRSKDRVINHKIFEIQHEKDPNDISANKLPKQTTQFVYSAYNIGQTVRDPQPSQSDKKTFAEKVTPDKAKNVGGKSTVETSSTSGKSQSSNSSGSVYVTPFFLMATGNEDKDYSKLIDQGTNTEIEPITEKDSVTEKHSAISKGIQTSFQEIEQMESSLIEKPQLRSVSLQTEPMMQETESQTTKEAFMQNYEPSEETMKNKFKDSDTVIGKDDNSDEIYWGKKTPKTSSEENSSIYKLKNEEVQTDINSSDEIDSNQTTQTEFRTSVESSRKYSVKSTQTSFSENLSSDLSNSTVSQTPDDMVTVRSLDEPKPQSNNKIAETDQEKSSSDSELYEKKKDKSATTPLSEAGLPNLKEKSNDEEFVVQSICTRFSKDNPQPYRGNDKPVINETESEAQKAVEQLSKADLCQLPNLKEKSNDEEFVVHSTCTRFSKDNPQPFRGNDMPVINETESEAQKAVEQLSKAEQTSLRDEYLPQALSDLSELKKIIVKFFESVNINESNKSEINKLTITDTKTDQGTMTDNIVMENKPVLSEAQKPRKMNSAETQTSTDILINEIIEENQSRKPKFRQSDDENERRNFFVCAVCGRDLGRLYLNASTNTDNNDNFPELKEKTTIIDTQYNEIIEVKTFKKTKSASIPKESINDSKPTPKRAASLDTEKGVKIPKSSENSPRDANLQKSGIPVLVPEPGPAYMKKDRSSSVPVGRKVKPLAQELPESAKSTSPQVRQSPRPLADQQLFRECLCNEIAEPSTSKSISPNTAKAPKSKIQPGVDIFPSLPKVEHPGVENSQWRKTERSPYANSKPKFRRTDGFFYPVTVESVWPTEITKAREFAEKSDNPVSSTSKQKRGYAKKQEPKGIPAEKKMKAFNEALKKESFLFEEPMNFDSSEGKLEKASKSISVPSRNDFVNQYKVTRSEELVRTSHQREAPIQVKKLGSDITSGLFTVESCHFKPVTFNYNQQSFNNLYECSFCKSLTFLKNNKENSCNVLPNTALLYHDRIPGRKPVEKVLKESIPDNPSQHDEEFLQECLDFSDTMLSPHEEFSKNNISEEEEEDEEREAEEEEEEEEEVEVEEEVNNKSNKSSPESKSLRFTSKSKRQGANVSDPPFYTDVRSTSDFLNTFRYSKGFEKYNFKKHSK